MTCLRATILCVFMLGWASCGRTEEPASEPKREPVRSAGAKHSAPAAAKPPERCIVPVPDTPPPLALPAASCPEDPTGDFKLPRATVRFVDAAGQPSITVELAREDRHRERGLMYRTKLGDDAGMLFSWPNERVRSFWMRNTCIPLDMLFIAADRTIVGILERVPTLNEASRTIPCPAMHVLEVRSGWTRERGIRPGQKIVIDE